MRYWSQNVQQLHINHLEHKHWFIGKWAEILLSSVQLDCAFHLTLYSESLCFAFLDYKTVFYLPLKIESVCLKAHPWRGSQIIALWGVDGGRLVQDSPSLEVGRGLMGTWGLEIPTQLWSQSMGLFWGWLLGWVMFSTPVPPEMNTWWGEVSVVMGFHHTRDSLEESASSFVLLYLAPTDAIDDCSTSALFAQCLIFYCKSLSCKNASLQKFLFPILI